MSSAIRERRAALEAQLRAREFAGPPQVGTDTLRFGAELEWLPVLTASRRLAPIESVTGPSGLALLRHAGSSHCWREERSSKGAPLFQVPGGGTLTFEPGGQIEYASPVCRSVSELLSRIRAVWHTLDDAADVQGIELLASGIDPDNGLRDAPLQLHAERYARMDAHFARFGDSGARMMRQTASLQLCVGGIQPVARWKLTNALAPYLVATFANSPRMAGRDSGHASARSANWRGVDPARTGLLPGEDPVREYLDFALLAPAFLIGEPRAPRPFCEWSEDVVTQEDWETHLTTLFPEVRPRGYLELRSLDALPLEHVPAAIVLVTALLADSRAAGEASEIVGAPDVTLLERAATCGLHDPRLASGARDLAAVGLAAAERLGAHLIAPADAELARDFFQRYTLRARMPADDSRAARAA